MNTINCTYQQAILHATDALQNKNEITLFAIADTLGYAIGEPQNTYNPQKIAELGGQIYNGHWNGGTCVVFPGDLSICRICNPDNNNNFGNKCIKLIGEFLNSKGLTIVRDGNDLLLFLPEKNTSKKVASYAESIVNDMTETVVHLSIGMNEEIIKQVCTKPMIKQPAGLKDYNITAEELIQFINKNIK